MKEKTGAELLTGLGHIQEALIQEGETGVFQKRKYYWGGGIAAAVCAALLVLVLLPTERGEIRPNPQEPAEESLVTVDLSKVAINPLGESMESSRLYFDPALYDRVEWSSEETAAYYGGDLTPAYLPGGLSPAKGNGGAVIFAKKDGTIVVDQMTLQFYHDYYEDGSPRLDGGAVKGFELSVSKVGFVRDCCYLLPEQEPEITEIGGHQAAIGYRAMSYGPYDPETHEPAGYYDFYTAEFEKDGISYFLQFHQLPLEEVVMVTASILCGTEKVGVSTGVE